MNLSEKAYDFIKKLVQVILPAIGAFYAGLAVLWGLPNPQEVVGSIALLCTFLGVILGISSAKFYRSDDVFDGVAVLTPGENGELEATAGLVTPAKDIAGKSHIVLRVAQPE